jgi:bcr-type benzoyl-CoA reductase subunit C
MTVLEKFVDCLADPYGPARQWKARGGKVIAVSPMHFPEELIHAAGALPVLLQETSEPVTSGYGHLYPFYCGLTRSIVDSAVKGGLAGFDGLVISDMCLQIRHMGHILRRQLPGVPLVYIQWPLIVDRTFPPDLTARKLERCRKQIEEIAGRPVTDEALRQSIAVYNRNRSLLRELASLRRERPGVVRARDFEAVVVASMVMPKEDHTSLLEDLLREVRKASPATPGRVPVILSGHLCQVVKTDLLDLVEDLGGAVVADDLYAGYRYFATDAPQDVAPLEALARRYLDLAVPCPTRCDPRRDWAGYLVDTVRQTGAKGVISLVPKFCEPHMIYYPHLRDVLAAAQVPHLLIETEHEVVSLAGVKTRLQAFFETLGH